MAKPGNDEMVFQVGQLVESLNVAGDDNNFDWY